MVVGVVVTQLEALGVRVVDCVALRDRVVVMVMLGLLLLVGEGV